MLPTENMKTHLPASKQHCIAAAFLMALPRRKTVHWPQSTPVCIIIIIIIVIIIIISGTIFLLLLLLLLLLFPLHIIEYTTGHDL